MEFISSEKGKPLIIYENFKFRRYRELKTTGELVWCCTNKNCLAKVYTLGENFIFSKKNGFHNHNRNDDLVNRQRISNAVKRKAEEDLCEKPSKLIYKELKNHPEALNNLSAKDVRYICNNISHTRAKLIPNLPKNISDIHTYLESVPVKTTKEENFLIINNSESNIIVFSCYSNIGFMCEQEVLYVDGTFDYCTKFFLQLFTIHAFKNEVYVPVAFCLLKDKNKSTYTKLFRMLTEKSMGMGFIFNPKNIVMDFEQAIHRSSLECFPNVRIIGCRFHLSQCW